MRAALIPDESLPSRERGLKSSLTRAALMPDDVAPLAEAWIKNFNFLDSDVSSILFLY